MTASKILFYLSLLFILGLVLEFFIQFSFWGWIIFFFASFIIIISFFLKSFEKKKIGIIIALGSLSLVLGISRFQIAELRL